MSIAAACPFCELSHPLLNGRLCNHSDTVAYPRGCPGSGLTLAEAQRRLQDVGAGEPLMLHPGPVLSGLEIQREGTEDPTDWRPYDPTKGGDSVGEGTLASDLITPPPEGELDASRFRFETTDYKQEVVYDMPAVPIQPPRKRARGRWYLVTGYEGYDTKQQILAALERRSRPPEDPNATVPEIASALIHGHLLMLRPVTRYELEPKQKP